MVRLVDDDHIRQFRDAPEALRKVALALEIRMAEYGEVAEVCTPAHASDVRKPITQVRFPNTFFCGLGCEQHDSLTLVQNQALDQHEANKGLAQADAVTKERAAVLARNL